MSRVLIFPSFPRAVLLSALALAACSPALNWREVRPEGTRLSLLLPCKPDKAQKVVPLGGRPTSLSMLGCDADGATFAVAIADVDDPSQAASVLALWQDLALANMKAVPASRQPLPLKIPGASPGTPVTRLQAQGQRADGTAVSGQAAYFAQGSQLFQVVMYAPHLMPEAAETFFSSLKLE
ncbi:hypothetical protein [Polaromonas sp. CG_9.11]|uniref:hypothetical protein n=1 Tax=Polaromonas sp. CG_9.11 TaxID=2787730 RepID=UPI0018CA48BC|nr:hypothetical protein [Polaromonas sp. CG_9.11]MBG6076853.1 hypothetical protein [Polaromonas sp. CG_9.11]